MDRLEYLDFELKLEKHEQRYAVSVIRSPAGEAEGEFALPFSDLELENLLLKVGRTRRGVRRIGSPEWQAAQAFGGKLFEAVCKGDVRGCFRSSLDRASQEGKGLRLKLRLLDTPELADLPWEYLYNRPLNRFLSLSTQTPIVRYIELPEPIPPLAVKPPLCILVMISSPSDYDQLDVELEKANLLSALSDLERRGMVKLEWLEEATLLALQRRLRRGGYHIFHFIGHGGFDERAQEGLLLMEDERGRGRPVSGQHLGVMLHDHRTLRLAVLNACEGARSSRTDPFAGTATTLVQQGIPAVVAMQSEITDEAAIVFAREFYAAIADGYPVDASLAEARKAIFATGNDVEWGKPVLYTRSPDGQIFDVTPGVKPPARSEAEEMSLAYEAAYRRGDLAAVLTLFGETAVLCIAGGPTFNGKEEITRWHKVAFQEPVPLKGMLTTEVSAGCISRLTITPDPDVALRYQSVIAKIEKEREKPPKPTGIPKQVEALARLMNIRRDGAEPPYVLVLGAGASLSSGCSSGARVIEDVVSQLSRKDVAALSWEEKIAEFYDLLDNLSPTERYTILKGHVVGQAPSPGYRHLAQLIKAGYFDIIFSTNFDVFLEDALSDAGLRARDFTVLIVNRENEEKIVQALGFPEPRVKLVKLHGDLPARIFAFTPEEIFQFSDKIEKVLKEYLGRDIIIVGHSMRDDDLNRCIGAQGGSIWYINPSPPTVSDFVGRALKVRGGTIISGEMGKFDDFFQALGEALLEAPVRAAREEEARRQAELSALYSKGMEALAAQDWLGARKLLAQIQEMEPGYRDVGALLSQAQAGQARAEQLATLLARGKERLGRGEWSQAAEAYRQALALAPDHPEALARLAEAERQEKVATLFTTAQGHLKAGRWSEAIVGFQAVLKLAPAHAEAARQLAEAQAQLERQEAEERARREEEARQAELARLYAVADEAAKARNWSKAIECFQAVLKLDASYRDAPARLAQVQEALAAEEATRQRAAQLARLYTQALEHLQAERWQEAIEGFRAVLEVAPTYKDATALLAEAKHKKELASLPKPPEEKKKPPKPVGLPEEIKARGKPKDLPR